MTTATKSSGARDTIVLERTYRASPDRVFHAWEDIKARARWMKPWPEMDLVFDSHDFRVGGKEHASGVSKDGTRHTYDALYLDIAPNERFVLTYWMHIDDTTISASLQTVEFARDGAGTLLTFTEQAAFLDGFDGPASREEGTRWLPEQVAQAIGG